MTQFQASRSNLFQGAIERADLDGKNRVLIVREGVTHTPKQIHLDKDGGKLHRCIIKEASR